MRFWLAVAPNFVANMLAAAIITGLYVLIQWFLAATDIDISYMWVGKKQSGESRFYQPILRVINRSRSRTYYIYEIKYEPPPGTPSWPPWDDQSVKDYELRPGSLHMIEAAVIPGLTDADLSTCDKVVLTVQLQNGREFWLTGQGPGQQAMSRLQRWAFAVRGRFEKSALPLE